jgi:hypothetical protein
MVWNLEDLEMLTSGIFAIQTGVVTRRLTNQHPGLCILYGVGGAISVGNFSEIYVEDVSDIYTLVNPPMTC